MKQWFLEHPQFMLVRSLDDGEDIIAEVYGDTLDERKANGDLLASAPRLQQTLNDIKFMLKSRGTANADQLATAIFDALREVEELL